MPRTYASVMRTVEPLMEGWPEDARFTKYSLIRHARRHLRFEQAAFRAMADRRRRSVERLHDGSVRMLDASVVLEAIQQRGVDLLLTDEIRPSVRDVLAATSVLRELELEADTVISQAEVLAQVDRIIQALRDEVPPEFLPAVIARIEGLDRGTRNLASPDAVWEELAPELEVTTR